MKDAQKIKQISTLIRKYRAKVVLGITDPAARERYALMPAARIYELRREGKSDAQIARAFGVSTQDLELREADLMVGLYDHKNARYSAVK